MWPRKLPSIVGVVRSEASNVVRALCFQGQAIVALRLMQIQALNDYSTLSLRMVQIQDPSIALPLRRAPAASSSTGIWCHAIDLPVR